jgi:putative DNA primase/helicase
MTGGAGFDLAEIRARTPVTEAVGRRVRLVRSGKQWKGCCPFHLEKTPSFHVFEDGYHCFGCGAHGDVIDFVMQTQGVEFLEAVKMLAANVGLDGPAGEPSPLRVDRKAELEQERARKIARGAAIYSDGVTIAGTPAEAYLRGRLGNITAPAVLRFHSACPRPTEDGVERFPAMVAPITDPVSNQLVGTHCTFLRPDGCGKIEHGKQKIMWGSWGAIRLSPDDDVTTGLGIAEGIETSLSLIQHAGWRPVWAAGCAGAIAKFPVLPGIECLTIFPDCDDSGAGLKAAEECAARWRLAGREVRMIWPPAGADWLDALVKVAA